MIIKLRRFRERVEPDSAVPPCQMCAESIEPEHRHVVDLESRALMCTCRGCYLLFLRPGAARGRYRAVPDRYVYTPTFVISAADWEELQIPVRMAFFFHNSSLGRSVAFYPGPGGATESELPLDTWERVLAANPRVADARPDVEALLVDRGPDGFGCYLVPIDACYELVGLLRLNWKGFTGGPQAWDALESYFRTLRGRCRETTLGRIDDLE
jgi:hypothetical protein